MKKSCLKKTVRVVEIIPPNPPLVKGGWGDFLVKKGSKIKPLLLIIIALFFSFACDQKPKNPVSEYGDALIGAYKRGQQAGEEANLDAVRKAIAAYHAANEKYPKSLDELKDMLGSNKIDLSKYEYNPDNGVVSIKK